MAAEKKVELIAWDAESPQHIERLKSQRRQCGWSWDKVAGSWKDAQLKGTKVLYWIVFTDENALKGDIEKHIATYPEDKQPLTDTAQKLRAKPRAATGRAFNPIGHIALDEEDREAEALGLDLATDGAYWIKTLYVSTTIHGGGVGRQAMNQIEREAIDPPLNAKHLILDTLFKEEFDREDFCMAYYGGRPKVIPQLWYERRGYELVGVVQDFYKERDRKGNQWPMRTAFLQRKLV